MKDWDEQWSDIFDKTSYQYDNVRNPNNYWQNPDGSFGCFFSTDTYPLSDDYVPFTLPGLQ